MKTTSRSLTPIFHFSIRRLVEFTINKYKLW